MLFANFEHSGKQRAAQIGHPEWTVAEWLRDPQCLEGALAGLVRAVWAQHPNEDVTLKDFHDWLRVPIRPRGLARVERLPASRGLACQ